MLEPNEITTMDFEELWNHFKRMRDTFTKGNPEKTYQQVRFGILHRFDIELYFNKLFTEKQKKRASVHREKDNTV